MRLNIRATRPVGVSSMRRPFRRGVLLAVVLVGGLVGAVWTGAVGAWANDGSTLALPQARVGDRVAYSTYVLDESGAEWEVESARLVELVAQEESLDDRLQNRLHLVVRTVSTDDQSE